jgi:CheY-like chemotaxis protein/nitrogen-specific signal transduction histidine kinase
VSEREDALRQEIREARTGADRANAIKSQFLATMSHEIRTPMNGVLGMADLLAQTKLDERQYRFVANIQRSAHALLGIINDILDFSKIEAGKLELDVVDFDLRDAIEGAVELLADSAHRKGLELITSLPPGLHSAVVGDPGRLQQIVTNLVGNAIKFTSHGEVSIEVDSLRETADDITVICAVRDTGVGLPPEVRERVFDAFQQADGSATRKFGGSGLGLAIVKQLTAMMEGEVGVESIDGKGCTFWFSVRFRKADSSPAGSARFDMRSVPTADLGVRVLLAEDNPLNQELMFDLMEAWGCDVDLARNGLEAIEKFSRERYDIVLMDCQMPELDGYQATRRIRELETTREDHEVVPIIALTANAMEGDRERCIDAGMTDFVSKPFDHGRLRSVMVRCIGLPDSSAPAQASSA